MLTHTAPSFSSFPFENSVTVERGRSVSQLSQQTLLCLHEILVTSQSM